ncbi:TOR1B [Branchiostoma lanceolatum]|uniref:TOR1B protein n=1 Tax=Branchiostoma lanceolatum TaxID=7740 RepID=A0A8K0ACA6_BRALA|nr:TOR1B [Branchiostoma lanceolatum]
MLKLFSFHLKFQVVSATQSWSAGNAVAGSLQPSSGANSAAWRHQVPQDGPVPLRKTLSVPAYFRSPALHDHAHSHIPNVAKGTRKPSPPPISPLLTHQSQTLTASAYSTALNSFPDRQINLRQWSPYASGNESEAFSTPNLLSTQPASLPLKRSNSSGTALTSPVGTALTSPVGTRETQGRPGMSPKCLSLPAMSPGSKHVGRYGTIPVPHPLLPPVSDSPTRSSPKPGRNLSTPPAKKKSLRHRKLGFPEANSRARLLAICTVTVVAVQLYQHEKINDWKHCSISDLEEELNRRVFGQHIAKRVVLGALSEHLGRKHGTAPLVMSFYGPSGVGKTFLSRIVSKFLSRSCGVRTHEFIIPHHFPHPEEAQLYREQVREWVRGNVSNSNRQHLFVFDEMEKVYPELAEGLLLALEEDTSDAIYIFICSTEELSMSDYVVEQLRNGRSRESIREDEIQDLLEQADTDSPEPSVTDFASSESDRNVAAAAVEQPSNIPEGHTAVKHATMVTAPPLIDDVSLKAVNLGGSRCNWSGVWGGKSPNLDRYFVPFLPLEREHVLKCAEVELATHGGAIAMETAQRIVDEMQFYPGERPIFSKYGCKRLSVRVEMSKEN